jgi:putative chitinase
MEISEHELRQFVPNARGDYISAIINGLEEIKRVGGISKIRRLRPFLAEAAHETNGFTIVREDTSWTPAQMCRLWPSRYKSTFDPRILACGRDPVKLANLAYSNRKELGNIGGNDGYDYRGGSFLQETGRANYRSTGTVLGIDLENNPSHIENADIGLKVALVRWQKMGCNKLADRGYTRAIGNAINRGNPYDDDDPIGYDSRQEWHRRALLLFPDSEGFLTGLALGAYGSEVEVLQRKLRELNYGVGKIDKVFGPATARAIAAFKFDQSRRGAGELEPDEIVGEKTWAALNLAPPVVLAKRQQTTVKELAKESETVKAATEAQAATAVIAGVSVVNGAQQVADAGMLGNLTETFSWAPAMHASMVPMVDALGWGFRNFWWVATLIAAVLIWRSHGRVIAARLRDHVKGWNLGR